MLYVLRASVVEALSEAGQKLLLQRLAALLQRPGCPVPTAVVALEGARMPKSWAKPLSALLSVVALSASAGRGGAGSAHSA